MVTPFLAINNRDGVQPRPVQYIGASASFLSGSTGFGTSNTALDDTSLSRCQLVRFGGAKTFFSVTGDNNIWTSTDAGATWSIAHALSGQNGNYGFATGPFVVSNPTTGVPYLCLFSNNFYGGGSAWYVDVLNGVTNTWSSFNGAAPTVFTGATCDVATFGGKLYVLELGNNNSNGVVAIFDVATNTVSFINFPCSGGQWSNSGALCSFQGRLFMLTNQFGGGRTVELWEIVGSTINHLLQLPTTSLLNYPGDARMALFTDNSFMYALYHNYTTGWYLQKIDPSLAVTDISSVLPAALASGSPPTTGRVGIMVDAEGTPGTAALSVYYAPNGAAGSTWTVYPFSPSVTWVAAGTGGSAAHAMPFNKVACGDYLYTAGDNGVQEVGMTSIPGGFQVSFKVTAPSGTPAVGLKAYFGYPTDAYATRPATMASPSIGTLSGAGAGNSIVSGTGLIADGSTQTFVWQAVTDGVSVGMRPKFVLEQI